MVHPQNMVTGPVPCSAPVRRAGAGMGEGQAVAGTGLLWELLARCRGIAGVSGSAGAAWLSWQRWLRQIGSTRPRGWAGPSGDGRLSPPRSLQKASGNPRVARSQRRLLFFFSKETELFLRCEAPLQLAPSSPLSLSPTRTRFCCLGGF